MRCSSTTPNNSSVQHLITWDIHLRFENEKEPNLKIGHMSVYFDLKHFSTSTASKIFKCNWIKVPYFLWNLHWSYLYSLQTFFSFPSISLHFYPWNNKSKHLEQPLEVFYKKGVLKKFAKFRGKHQCQSHVFIKVAG